MHSPPGATGRKIPNVPETGRICPNTALTFHVEFDKMVSGDLAKFSDASAVASWASDAMIWAVSEGLVKGSGSNLNPTATATRAQVVTILYRLMEK